MMPTMKQGLITLIPKPGKDKEVLDNLRPITPLNVDYKLFAHIFANRLKKVYLSLLVNLNLDSLENGQFTTTLD